MIGTAIIPQKGAKTFSSQYSPKPISFKNKTITSHDYHWREKPELFYNYSKNKGITYADNLHKGANIKPKKGGLESLWQNRNP